MTRDDWNAARPLIVAGLAILAAYFLFTVLLSIRTLIAAIFLGVILGVVLNPFTDAVARYRVPRIAAILVVYGIVAALFAIVITFSVIEIAAQDFSRELSELRAEYEDLRAGTALPAAADVEDALRAFGEQAIGGIAGRVWTLLIALVGVITILVTAILFSITQERIREVILSFINPARRPRVVEVLELYARGMRGFARGEIIAMVVVGVITFVGLSILGVRFALVLAFIAFIMEILPMIGPWIAVIPALIVGFTQGTFVGIQVALFYLALQMFESYVLTPLIHSRESEVPALLIFISITVGGALMGILGALIALPIAVLLRITYYEVIKPWNESRFRPRLDGAALQPAAQGLDEETAVEGDGRA